MTYRELFYKATRLIDKGEITLGEYDEMTKPLDREIEQQPCERFEWGIDGKVYKITKAKDGKEICKQVCDDAISREAVCEIISDIRDCISVEGYCAILERLKKLSSVTPQQKYGKWIDYREDGFVECPFCGHATNCEDDIDELHYCFYCGAKMESEVNNG